MLKRILISLAVGFFVFGLTGLSFAMNCHGKASEHKSRQQIAQADTEHKHDVATPSIPATTKAEEVGNKICPVMGTKIKKGEEVKYEYQGKIYNFCCPMCIEEFKKDPEKYIKKVEEELQGKSTKSEAAEKTETKAMEEIEHHHGHGM